MGNGREETTTETRDAAQWRYRRKRRLLCTLPRQHAIEDAAVAEPHVEELGGAKQDGGCRRESHERARCPECRVESNHRADLRREGEAGRLRCCLRGTCDWECVMNLEF